MSENEQAEAVWQIATALPEAAAMIAKDAREGWSAAEETKRLGSKDPLLGEIVYH